MPPRQTARKITRGSPYEFASASIQETTPTSMTDKGGVSVLGTSHSTATTTTGPRQKTTARKLVRGAPKPPRKTARKRCPPTPPHRNIACKTTGWRPPPKRIWNESSLHISKGLRPPVKGTKAYHEYQIQVIRRIFQRNTRSFVAEKNIELEGQKVKSRKATSANKKKNTTGASSSQNEDDVIVLSSDHEDEVEEVDDEEEYYDDNAEFYDDALAIGLQKHDLEHDDDELNMEEGDEDVVEILPSLPPGYSGSIVASNISFEQQDEDDALDNK